MANYGKGYNNPAYSNHYDGSLFEYEYVPEIDPDSPERNSNYSPLKKLVPSNKQIPVNNSVQLNNSDESNGSVVIEECNNRRVTMICEKRGVKEVEGGGYFHDISWESNPDEENNEMGFIPINTDNYHRQSKRKNNSNREHSKPEMEEWQFQKGQRQHRYEELDVPKLNNEREIMKRPQHRYAFITDDFEANGVRFLTKKPRAPSPMSRPTSGHSTPSLGGSAPNTPRSKVFGTSTSRQCNYNTISPILYPNNLEMADFSPPRYTQFCREPPIGASSSHETELSCSSKISGKYPLDKVNLSNTVKLNIAPSPPPPLRTPQSTHLTPERSTRRQRVRRNISSSFQNDCSSPYRSTTESLSKNLSPTAKSKVTRNKTGIMYKSSENFFNFEGISHSPWKCDTNIMPVDRIKRNKSVPNFLSPSTPQNRSPVKAYPERQGQSTRACRVAVAESPSNYSSIGRSRTSLFDDLRDSWSQMSNFTNPYGCLPIAAFIQLVIGMATCGICFYLFLKLSRRYYLDLGTIGGFTSAVMGVLGFRAQRWNWLPHRNYMTGYFVSTVFSILTFICLLLILTVRPMSGDPILDVLAGAISTISVIIIGLAVTGLTMSGCCKTPPPDNRVTCA